MFRTRPYLSKIPSFTLPKNWVQVVYNDNSINIFEDNEDRLVCVSVCVAFK